MTRYRELMTVAKAIRLGSVSLVLKVIALPALIEAGPTLRKTFVQKKIGRSPTPSMNAGALKQSRDGLFGRERNGCFPELS